MSSVYDKIREYGQQRDQNRLELFIRSLDEEELVNVIKQRINNANFTETWNYVLKSFRDTPDCHRKRCALVLSILKELENKDFDNSRINTVLHRMCLEVPKFKSEDLAKICTFCLETLQAKKSCKMRWKDLLPEVLNVLVERETFSVDEIDYIGSEYKSEFISSLCMTSWSPSVVTSLTSVFIDMPLTKDEHLKLVNKLGTYLEKMTPQEIPAFVYQLLKFCKQYNGRSLFLKLQSYFGLRIYNLDIQNESSPDSNLDLDAIESTNNQDTIEAESTVLYHIHNAASLGHGCIKDYLNSLKNTLKAPEFVLKPFQLMVLFSISTIPHYEEIVFDIIRPCIVRAFNEEQRKNNSHWFKEMVSTTVKPEEVFSQVIHYSLQDREHVLEALVNFAFVLLGIGSFLGRDPIAEKQWNLGNLILLKIIKRKRHVATMVIQLLCNNIVTRQSCSQYIECLYILSRSLPLLMLESQSCIVELIDSVMQIPGTTANQLLDALIPLTKVSPGLRDHLIILLRKALYSRSVETRQMAVSGFLKLIRGLKISNMASLSQSNNSLSSFASGHSLFTQISLSRNTQTIGTSAFSNEGLCLEVLSILKRCFIQQSEVRSQLYVGLYDSISLNSELGIPALDVIWFHFSEFYVMDEEQLPPLNFKKIVVLKETDSILVEPLGKLVYAIGLIVAKISETEDKENATLQKFTNILESLCARMANCELVNFELDDGTDLLDILPESQEKMHILKEVMTVYEALIGYKICSWNKESENQGKTINSLYQGYNRLVHFSKTLSKPKKADTKKKKLDGNKSDQQTQSNVTKKDGQKHSKTYKIPDTILDFQSIHKALILLHEPKPTWTTVTEANVVKVKREFHQHIMQATIYLVQNIKRHKDIDTQLRMQCYDNLTDVAVILFTRIIKRFNEFIDFDCITAILALECFNSILVLIANQYRSNLQSFLNKIVGDENRSIVAQLRVIIEIYQKLFELDEEEISEDTEIKKMSFVVMNTLTTLSGFIPSESNPVAIELFEWLKNYSYNKTVSSKVSNVFINLFFETHIKYKVSLTIIEQFSLSIGEVIGVITEEEQRPEKFKVINEASAHNILLSLCSNMKSILEDIDAVIARLKSEYYILLYPGTDNIEKKRDNMKIKERGVCCHLCFLVNIMTNLTNLLIQPGNLSEAIFKSIILLFGTLTSLSKHFIARSSKANLAFQGARWYKGVLYLSFYTFRAIYNRLDKLRSYTSYLSVVKPVYHRFDRLVKLTGKQLAPTVYKFILQIEESQKQDTQATQGKKKQKSIDTGVLKSKVLRETRLIPKVVYEMEQFGKCVIQLSNKTKVDLSKYMGQGTTRDFRILKLDEILKVDRVNDTEHDDTTQEVDQEEQNEVDMTEEIGDDSNDSATPPPSKKSRR